MAAHQYWRLSFAALDGGTALTVAGIELRGAAGGPNLATATTAARTATWSLAAGSGMTTATGDGNASATGYAFESTIQGVGNGVASRILTVIGGAATVKGSYTVDSEAGFDYMRILVNGVVQVQDSGLAKSGTFSVDVPGNGTVEFRYSKDGSGNGGTDKATWSGVWLDGPPTVIASATGGALAFDSNASTAWAATGSTVGTIRYDFGTSPQDIVEHAVQAPAATPTNAPKQWTLAWSDDDANFTTVAAVFGQTGWTAGQNRVFTHSAWPATIGKGFTGLMARQAQTVRPVTQRNLGLGAYGGTRMFTPAGPHSYVTGTVTEDGVPVQRVVRMYRRDNGFFLNQTTSAADGTFQFSSNGYRGECVVIVFSSLLGPPAYNAVVYDGVIPI